MSTDSTGGTTETDRSKTEEYREIMSLLNAPPLTEDATGIEVELTFISIYGEYQHKLIGWGNAGKEPFRNSREYARIIEALDYYWLFCPDEIRVTVMVSVTAGNRAVSQRMVDWTAPGIPEK